METIRAALVRVGDVTPAGRVERVDYFGELRRLVLVIDGTDYPRGFDDLVDVAVLEPPPEVEP